MMVLHHITVNICRKLKATLAAEYTNTGGTNLYGFDLSGTTSAAGYKGYKKAIDILSNQDEYDINMLALPGVIKSLHSISNKCWY